MKNQCIDISLMNVELSKIENELCEEEPEVTVAVSKLVNLRNDVNQLETNFESVVDFLKGPSLNKAEVSDFFSIRNSFFETIDKMTPTRVKYFPKFLRALKKAARNNDYETFKSIIESPGMPPDTLKSVIAYHFEDGIADYTDKEEFINFDEDNLLGGKDSDEPYSLLLLASSCKSVDIVRYLMNCEGIDLLETCGGKNIVHLLLDTKNISKSSEKLVEELWQMKPELVHSCWSNWSMLQLAIEANSDHLCRVLIQKYDVDVNQQFPDGSTPLIHAIRLKSQKAFDELISLGSSAEITGKGQNNCMHMACKVDWPHAINKIFPRYPGMVNCKNVHGVSPLNYILSFESLNALQAIAKCSRYGHVQVSYLEKLKKLAKAKKAKKVVAWFESFKPT